MLVYPIYYRIIRHPNTRCIYYFASSILSSLNLCHVKIQTSTGASGPLDHWRGTHLGVQVIQDLLDGTVLLDEVDGALGADPLDGAAVVAAQQDAKVHKLRRIQHGNTSGLLADKQTPSSKSAQSVWET